MCKVKSATYTTMVRPTFEYASAVWDPHKQKDSLEKLGHRRAAMYVNNNYMDISPGSVTSMLKHLKWTSLEYRRRQIRLGMLYKINRDLVDTNPASFFHYSDLRTRGAQRLHQEQIQHPAIYLLSPFNGVLPDRVD